MLARRCRLLIIIFCCLINYSFAQTQGIISGTIYNEDQAVLPYALISLGNQHISSDEKGYFEFQNISAGSHILIISEFGYKTFTDTIVKHASENLVLNIQLTPSNNTLDEINLVGKTEKQRISEQPIRTQVIETQATATQASSLTDLMNQNTGIRIRQNGGLGSTPEISINGFQGRSVKYFKDGIPLDFLGDGYNISSLPMEALDHVEVYKGVLPVSLGADALGGAVNLVTRKRGGSHLNAFYEVGSFNTHRMGLMGATESKNENWFLGTEMFMNYSDNDYRANVEVVDSETRNEEIVRLPMFHNQFKNYYTELFAGIQNQSWADELRVSIATFNLVKEQQHPALMTDAYGDVHSKQSSVVPTIRYKKELLNGKLSIDQFASYNDLRTQRIDTLRGSYDWYGNFTPKNSIGESRLPSQSDVHEKQITARTNATYRISTLSRVTLNYVFTNANRSGKDPYGPKLEDTNIDVLSLTSTYRKNVLGASLDNYLLDSKLHNQAMVKYYVYNASGIQNTWFSTDITLLDKHSKSANYWGFADALKYYISNSSMVRASAEFTYRLPERDELFGNNVFIVPNFELNPEKSFNVNLGYQFNYQNKFYTEINSFYRRTTDMILLVPIQAPNAQYQNQENIKGFGFDIDLSYSFWDKYKISTNASWQNLRLFGITNLQDTWKNNARLRNTPYFFANVGLDAKYKDVFANNDALKLFINYNFMREFYLETIPKSLEPGGFLGLSGSAKLNSNLLIPNQHLFNLGVTYQHPSEHISIGAEIRNLFNKELFDYYRISKPGRSFNIKISYNL